MAKKKAAKRSAPSRGGNKSSPPANASPLAAAETATASTTVDCGIVHLLLRLDPPMGLTVRADPNPAAGPTQCQFLGTRSSADADKVQYLQTILAKVGSAFGTGKVRFAVQGNKILG